MKSLIIIAICALAAATAYAEPLTLEAVPRGVDDGDTLVLHLRSQGIDAPEKGQLCEKADGTCYDCGLAAKAVFDAMLRKPAGSDTKYRELKLKIWSIDRYGRPVVTPFLMGVDMNKYMVDQGYALVYERYLPDELRADYLFVQDRARKAKRGIWKGRFIEPWRWRRGERLPCEVTQ